MYDPPPFSAPPESHPPLRRPPEWVSRADRLLAAAAWPWIVVLALLGAAGLAFPPWLGTAQPGGPVTPAGPTVEVISDGWPHPRWVGVGWATRDWPRESFGWLTWERRSGVGRVDIGFDPPAPPAPPWTRPPGAAVDHRAYFASLWWLLGPAAASSAFAGWRAMRGAPRPPSIAGRLARPWVAASAVAGAALLAGNIEIPDRNGPNSTVFEARPQRTPAGSWHPREVVVTVAGTRPGGGGLRWAWGATVGVWWFAAAAAAANGVTVARRRPRRGSEPAADAPG